jgi:hypothetical protein
VNDGTGLAEKAKVVLNADYPFHLKTTGRNLDKYQLLCAGCTQADTYYLVVSPDAVSGTYPLHFRILYDGQEIKKDERDVYINVLGKPDIVIKTRLAEKFVVPGSESLAFLEVENIGTGIARYVKLTHDSSDFILMGENQIVIDQIKPKEKFIINVTFSASSSLEPDTYLVPCMITYQDETGNNLDSTVNVGIKVINKAEVNIQRLKFNPHQIRPFEEFTIQATIENSGEGTADNVKVDLESNDLIGFKKAYIGELEEGDDAPAIFSVRSTKLGTLDAFLVIHYLDDLGEHIVRESIPIEVSDHMYIKKYQSNKLVWVLAVILFIFAGVILFLGRKYVKKRGFPKWLRKWV